MSSDAMREFLEVVEAEVQSRPTAIEFEMAYQARVAMDRIRFAIKHAEQFGPRTDQMCAKLGSSCSTHLFDWNRPSGVFKEGFGHPRVTPMGEREATSRTVSPVMLGMGRPYEPGGSVHGTATGRVQRNRVRGFSTGRSAVACQRSAARTRN
jgi:hypothetical protein